MRLVVYLEHTAFALCMGMVTAAGTKGKEKEQALLDVLTDWFHSWFRVHGRIDRERIYGKYDLQIVRAQPARSTVE